MVSSFVRRASFLSYDGLVGKVKEMVNPPFYIQTAPPLAPFLLCTLNESPLFLYLIGHMASLFW